MATVTASSRRSRRAPGRACADRRCRRSELLRGGRAALAEELIRRRLQLDGQADEVPPAELVVIAVGGADIVVVGRGIDPFGVFVREVVDAAGALSFLGWTSGVPQQPGMWFQVELPTVQKLTEIQFTTLPVGGRSGSPAAWTYPRRYQVQVSTDGTSWSTAVAEGEGAPGTTVIAFAPVDARFVRITQTGTASDAPPWSMRLLRLYVAPVNRSSR